jgi:hypothetical protein
MNSENKYEFGDFSFFENTREYYDHVVFLSIIEKYKLWDFVKIYSSIDTYSIEHNNKYLIFEDYYNNIGDYINKSVYIEIMENFEQISQIGWDLFVMENLEYN